MLVINFKKQRLICIVLIIIIFIVFGISLIFRTMCCDKKNKLFAGGNIHNTYYIRDNEFEKVFNDKEFLNRNRFRRPSSDTGIINKYSFNDFVTDGIGSSINMKNFNTPENVIYAYYGILENASNMQGYCGGCGSVGDSIAPYAYAYKFFSDKNKEKVTFSEFENSFSGIGHITFLSLYEAYRPSETDEHINYYMIEIEVISGNKQCTDPTCSKSSSNFNYYYGIITTEKTELNEYKIDRIDYFTEDFLCAPYHGWIYSSEYVIELIYKESLNVIDTIEKIEQKGRMIYAYASFKDKKYRLDFFRLTNGYDILLHENILINGKWEETDLLNDTWKNFKFSNLNVDF